jgi:hypothetical protein
VKVLDQSSLTSALDLYWVKIEPSTLEMMKPKPGTIGVSRAPSPGVAEKALPSESTTHR